MKGKLLLASATIATMGLISFKNTEISGFTNYKKHKLQFGGGQSGLTGAPGEDNCTQCHVGTVNAGSSVNSLNVASGLNLVSGYIPGQTYNVTVQMNTQSTKKGFSAVALDINNNNAGSFTGLTTSGTQNFSSGNREYVSHTSSSTGAIAWIWQWTAPATDVGDVFFYVATNETNDDGTTSGDQIYVSQHVVGSAASVEENSFSHNFSAGFNNATNQLTVSFESLVVNTMHLNLVDMSGKSAFTYTLDDSVIGENQETIVLPETLKSGVYFVNFFVGNNAMSSKIIVQ